MANADVKLTADLEAGDVTKAASELQKRIKGIFEDAASGEVSAEFQKIQVSAAKAANSVDTAWDAMKRLENTPTPEFSEVVAEGERLNAELNKAQQNVDKLFAAAAKYVKENGGTDAKIHTFAWDDTLRKIHKIKEEQAALTAETERYSSTAPAEVRELINEYQDLSQIYQELKTESEQYLGGAMGGDKSAIAAYDAYKEVFAEIEKRLSAIPPLMDEAFMDSGVEADMTAKKFFDTAEKVKNLETALKDARRQLKDMRKDGAEFTTVIDTSIYRQFEEDIKKAQEKVAELTKEQEANTQQQEKMKAAGSDSIATISDKYQTLIDKLQLANNELSYQIRRLEEARDAAKKIDEAGGDDKKTPSQAIAGWQLLINTINQGPKAIVQFADTVASTLPPAFQVAYAAVKKLAGVVIGALKESWELVSGTIKKGFVKAVNSATSAVKQLGKALLSLTGKVMLGPFTKLADSIKNIKKQADSSIPSLKQMGRAFIQYGLGARSLYFFVRKLRTALFEGFGDLAVAYEPFNAAMSQIITSLSYLRNSFVAAFAPIIQYVSPALSLLINKLAAAVQMLGQFIAALTGKEFVMAMPVYQDYASTTKAGAAAAKEAAAAEKDAAKQEKNRAKALKEIERTIAGFDDVEILKEPKNTDSGSSGTSTPSGSGVGGGGGLTFKTAPVADGLQKFADMIKKAWLQADFYDLGVLMAKQLGNLLRAFHDNVPKIDAFLGKVAKSIATFLAGFLSVHDTFKMLGVAIADAINLIFSAINTFLQTFMALDGFKNLGKDIYYAVVNALANIDWSTIYTVFMELGVGIAQTLNEVLTKPDLWELIFQTLCNALRAVLLRFYFFALNLHWGDIGTAIGSGLVKGINEFPFTLLAQSAATFISGIFTALGNMARKVEAEGGWYTLGQNIGNAVMTFFNGVFTKENGQSLGVFVQGIFNALRGFVETTDFNQVAQDVIDFISGFFDEFDWKENADTILKLINNLLAAFENAVLGENWEKIIEDIWNYIATSPEVQKFLANIWTTIQNIAKVKLELALLKFGLLGSMIVGGILNGIVDGIIGIGLWIKENVFDPIFNAVKKAFGIKSPSKEMKPLGKYVVEGFFGGITDKLKDVGTWIKEHIFTPFKNGLDGAFGIVGGVASKIKSIGNAVVSGFKKGADEKKSELDTGTKQINTDTQKNLSAGDWKGIGSTAINSMKSGIDSVKDRIHTVSQAINQSMFRALETGQWRTIGTRAITAIQDGMNTIKPYITQTASNIQNSIFNAFNNGNWFSIGDNIINGIWRGLSSGWNWLYNKVWNLAVDLYNAAMRALGIHSPSKVFAEKVGEMIPAGIGVGITDNESAATKPIEEMSESLVDTAKKIKIPPIAMGEVIPTNTATQEDSAVTLNSLLDVLQSLESDVVKRDELEEIITNIVRTYMNIDFYIGDEKLARHANRGNSLLDRRYHPVTT